MVKHKNTHMISLVNDAQSAATMPYAQSISHLTEVKLVPFNTVNKQCSKWWLWDLQQKKLK